MKKFKKIIESLKNLNDSEKKELIKWIKLNHEKLQEVTEIRKSKFESFEITCHYCGSLKCSFHQKSKRGSRYRCKNCKKTFQEITGSVICGIHDLQKWTDFIPLFAASLSIRKCAQQLEISPTTVFNWRHKILCSLFDADLLNYKKGIVDGKSFKENFTIKSRHSAQHKHFHLISKPVKIVTLTEKLSQRANLQMVSINSQISKSTQKKIKTQLHNCSINSTETTVWKEIDLKLVKNYNIKRNNLAITTTWLFYNWFDKFCGVSTKYLQNYLNWYNLLERVKDKNLGITKMVELILVSNLAIKNFNNIELDFEEKYHLQNSVT